MCSLSRVAGPSASKCKNTLAGELPMISKNTSAASATLKRSEQSPEVRENRRQLSRFLVVGVASVATDLAVYRLLVSMAGLPLDVAKGLSYWAGVVVGFFGNKWWTFRSSRRSWAEPFSYAALYAVTMLVNIACNRGVLAALGSNWVAMPIAFLFATGVTTVLNFLGMRLFTFRKGVSDRLQRESDVRSEHFASGTSQTLLRRSA